MSEKSNLAWQEWLKTIPNALKTVHIDYLHALFLHGYIAGYQHCLDVYNESKR